VAQVPRARAERETVRRASKWRGKGWEVSVWQEQARLAVGQELERGQRIHPGRVRETTTALPAEASPLAVPCLPVTVTVTVTVSCDCGCARGGIGRVEGVEVAAQAGVPETASGREGGPRPPPPSCAPTSSCGMPGPDPDPGPALTLILIPGLRPNPDAGPRPHSNPDPDPNSRADPDPSPDPSPDPDSSTVPDSCPSSTAVDCHVPWRYSGCLRGASCAGATGGSRTPLAWGG